MSGGLHEFRLAGARRVLREAGYADLAPLLDGAVPAPVEPVPVEPAPVNPAKAYDPMVALLGAPEVFCLCVVDGRIRGPDGWGKLSAGLGLLVRALRAGGEPVEHEYTEQSCERTLRAARADLAEIAPNLADLILPPTVRGDTVRVVTRRPVRVEIVDRLSSEVYGRSPGYVPPQQDLSRMRRG
jgi:hypothetical protein